MPGKHKKFSSQLHKENDPIGKKIGIVILNKMGYEVKENEDRFGVDLVLLKNNEVDGYAEVEIKHNWADGREFPYDTVHILERKEKFAKLDKPTLFIVINALQNRALVIQGKDVLESKILVVKNIYVSKDELFYHVPTKKAIGISNIRLEDNTCEYDIIKKIEEIPIETVPVPESIPIKVVSCVTRTDRDAWYEQNWWVEIIMYG